MNKQEPTFSMSEGPANSLIVHRCNLIEGLELYLRQQASNTRALHLTSLMSRVSDSGHIKHGEGTPPKITLSASIEYGVNHRARFMQGNRRWLCGERFQYVSPYEHDKEPEPRTILRKKLKTRVIEGVEQAKTYAREFGADYLYKPATAQEAEQAERGRTLRRTNSGAFDRKKVIDALTLLRNTWPAEYEDALDEAQWGERNRVNRKAKAAKVRTLMPSPTTRPQSPPPKCLYSHSNPSNVSFISFASADTFGAGIKKVKNKAGKIVTAMRKVASKIPGLRRIKGEENLREHFSAHSAETLSESTDSSRHSTDSPSPFEQALRRVGVQDKPARISEWTSVVEYNPATPEEQNRPVKLRDSIYDSPQHASNRTSREFTIDAGISDVPEAHPKIFFIDGGIVLTPSSPISPIEELYNDAAASVEDLTIIDPSCDQVEHSNTAELSAIQFTSSTTTELSLAELPVAELPSGLFASAPAGRVSSNSVALLQPAAAVEVKMRKRDRFRGRFTFGARL